MADRAQITTVGDGILVLAPAKINLSLLIAGKRPDGFHEIETIMAKVNWYDEILIEPGCQRRIELICRGPHWAPHGRDNLVWRAAEMLLSDCRPKPDIRITLTKNIPAGTGLGSASSDAAAALIGLCHHLRMGLDEEDLHNLATGLGSDVPFFLGGPLAMCKGKGEKIEKIEEKFEFTALIALPNVSISTEKAYANYTHRPDVYEELAGQIKAFLGQNRIDLAAKMCANMLEESCFDLDESLARLKKESESLDIGSFCLSGSGSAMFCIIECGDQDKAEGIRRRFDEKVGCKCILVANNRW
ncbi:MAG: 4-(cytidine 5'-diphospho)-2-C-methyl-D-erythritol kinase [Phycisphaerales bacterium]|nr:MAG: 4-(cytidine 5'-diphospho)-2-C-methyl-D-erythritol kinase [Phycisphaerales bacterium]